LIRTVNQLEQIQSGEIWVDGVDVASPATDLNKIRAEVGFVFQHFNLYPHLSVLENIVLSPIKVKKQSRAQAEEKALQLLERVGLAHKKDAMPGELSGGQQQRVSIARVLTKKPKIIFADEPTGNLDKQTANEVMQVLFDYINENNAALVLVTHDNDLAAKCDNSYKLENKELVQIS
ncbi:ATP-binding cassette domain-containing protein, partial [uncultured Campylobacter sp.]|uniref:ATP-binding cassette domain-containing protein n=1 Tax=uncultured Campylobacter sp. TaxID=218934 RepID=UPI00262B24C6